MFSMILVHNARILYVIYTVFWHVGHIFPAFLHQHPHRIGRTVWMSDKDRSPATIEKTPHYSVGCFFYLSDQRRT